MNLAKKHPSNCACCSGANHVKRLMDVPEIAKKIRLERIFRRELRPAFVQLLRDYRVSVAAFGRAPDASQYAPVFNGLLLNHISRTQRAFKGEVADQNGGKAFLLILVKQDEARLDNLIDLALLEWKSTSAEQNTHFLTETNQRQMDQGIITARQSLEEQGLEVTPITLAAAASAIVARQFKVRTNTIAQTVTQESAESTKQIEATAIGGRAPFNVGPTFIEPTVERVDVTKTWVDFGDSRVRPTHIAVSGTTLPENGIFNVGSSRMRFPSDTSLQAGIEEYINCRCSGQYKIATT